MSPYSLSRSGQVILLECSRDVDQTIVVSCDTDEFPESITTIEYSVNRDTLTAPDSENIETHVILRHMLQCIH